MRITGGQSKGLTIKTPRGLNVRPTSGKVREALFAILSPRITGARVLDLFAGTGAIGIEALSRGASFVDFVEHDTESLKSLEANLRRSGWGERARIHRQDIFRFLGRNAAATEPYDIVFVDPPYHTFDLRRLLPRLGQDGIIKPSGIIVIEHFHKLDLPKRIGPYQAVRSTRYGDSVLSFYQPA